MKSLKNGKHSGAISGFSKLNAQEWDLLENISSINQIFQIFDTQKKGPQIEERRNTESSANLGVKFPLTQTLTPKKGPK